MTPDKFERILSAVKSVQRNNVDEWRKLLKGLWLSTLSVSTLAALSWEPGGETYIDAAVEPPEFAIRGLRRSAPYRREPMPPAFWELVAELPERRIGYVFKLTSRNGNQASSDKIVKTVSLVCGVAGIATDEAKMLFAVSRDISGGGMMQ